MTHHPVLPLSGRWQTEQIRGPRLKPTWLSAHDREHVWRASGEWAIREEMERRVAVWLTQKRGNV